MQSKNTFLFPCIRKGGTVSEIINNTIKIVMYEVIVRFINHADTYYTWDKLIQNATLYHNKFCNESIQCRIYFRIFSVYATVCKLL